MTQKNPKNAPFSIHQRNFFTTDHFLSSFIHSLWLLLLFCVHTHVVCHKSVFLNNPWQRLTYYFSGTRYQHSTNKKILFVLIMRRLFDGDECLETEKVIKTICWLMQESIVVLLKVFFLGNSYTVMWREGTHSKKNEN